VTIRKWVYLFFTTLAIGGVVGACFRLAYSWGVLTEGSFLNFLFGLIALIGYGFLFSAISQMGFFAYLTVHRFGLAMFGSFWKTILVVLTVFILFDLFYFRMVSFRDAGDSAAGFMIMPLFLLLFSWAVSYRKSKETNRRAFVPTLFFMVVVTTVEWYYPLKTNDPAFVWPTLAVLLACNAWQVLLLHRLIQKPKKG
jgi:KinB signaling pathway activation protein